MQEAKKEETNKKPREAHAWQYTFCWDKIRETIRP